MARTKNAVSAAAHDFIESIEAIKVFKVDKGVVYAKATITFDIGIVVTGFTVFQKEGSQWLSLPTAKNGDSYSPIAWFNKELFSDDDKAYIKQELLSRIIKEVEE